MANKKTEYSIQYLENLSADLSVSPPVLRRALVGKDSDGNYYNVSVNPMGEMDVNASLEITEAVVGTVTTKTIQKTIGTTVYQKTIAKDSSDNSIEISAWREI